MEPTRFDRPVGVRGFVHVSHWQHTAVAMQRPSCQSNTAGTPTTTQQLRQSRIDAASIFEFYFCLTVVLICLLWCCPRHHCVLEFREYQQHLGRVDVSGGVALRTWRQRADRSRTGLGRLIGSLGISRACRAFEDRTLREASPLHATRIAVGARRRTRTEPPSESRRRVFRVRRGCRCRG